MARVSGFETRLTEEVGLHVEGLELGGGGSAVRTEGPHFDDCKAYEVASCSATRS
jgi:hypothetical protein